MAIKSSISSLSLASAKQTVASAPLKNSFLIGGVGALKSVQVRRSDSNRMRLNRSLGIQMNLLDRLARVVKSYANEIISSLEDPEKILDQTVQEMSDELIKLRQSTAQVLASQKQLENKYKAAQQASCDWYKRAELALDKGEEDFSREALIRHKSYSDKASSLKVQLDQQNGISENLVSNTQILESKIREARSKMEILKARAQSAKTAIKVNEILGNVKASSSLESMDDKVTAMESQAETLNRLTDDELEGKFAMFDGSSVDDNFANLKSQVSGISLILGAVLILVSTLVPALAVTAWVAAGIVAVTAAITTTAAVAAAISVVMAATVAATVAATAVAWTTLGAAATAAAAGVAVAVGGSALAAGVLVAMAIGGQEKQKQRQRRRRR